MFSKSVVHIYIWLIKKFMMGSEFSKSGPLQPFCGSGLKGARFAQAERGSLRLGLKRLLCMR